MPIELARDVEDFLEARGFLLTRRSGTVRRNSTKARKVLECGRPLPLSLGGRGSTRAQESRADVEVRPPSCVLMRSGITGSDGGFMERSCAALVKKGAWFTPSSSWG